MPFVIGIDVGGTFTDAVAADDGGTVVGAKSPSTPENYGEGVMNAVRGLAETLGQTPEQLLQDTEYIAHGTTASINALVTGNVEQVGFLTTRGHGDSIAIMNAEGRYLGLSPEEVQDLVKTGKPRALVAKNFVEEITERIGSSGEVIVSVAEDEVRAAVERFKARGVGAIAVSLLWSFKNPAHEQRIRELIREIAPEMFVSLSSDVSPRIREFSRNVTTIMNAQLGPPLERYLRPLGQELDDLGLAGPLLIMQSSGGTISAEEAPASAITTVGSVLSGGVVGAARLAEQLGHSNVITADIGGTTFLVGLIIDGEPVRASTTVINQNPVNVSAVKVTAIGSGGGAIAWLDAGGNLRVGPKSAQAVPGPAAYGTGGTLPTVTDADLVLGIIDPDFFMGGRRKLSRELAEAALLTHVGKPLGLTTQEAAAAVYEVQNSQTADLARKVVVESGHDPRGFAVYAFGGAGPIHASSFTNRLGATELVVPLGAAASGFSAYGLAASDLMSVAEISEPAPFPLDPRRVQEIYDRLELQVRDALERQGIGLGSLEIEREFDARFSAQMFEVTTPAPKGPVDARAIGGMAEAFERRYAEIYGEGAGFSAAGIQVISYRVRGVGKLPFQPKLPLHPMAASHNPAAAIKSRRPVLLDVARGFAETTIYDYELLQSGHVVSGPAVIEVPTTTVTVPLGVDARVDAWGNVHMEIG